MQHSEKHGSRHKEVLKFRDIHHDEYTFNHVVKAGKTLYLTSQLSCDLHSGTILPGTIEAQTQQALDNVRYLLERSHSSLHNIVKVTIYMRHIAEFSRMEAIYRTYFEPGEAPARVTVQAASPIDGIDIEIDVIAVVNDG